MLRIKELREELGITQKKLADDISNMQRNISNWETGMSEPDLATVVVLADYFGVSLDELFGRDANAATRPDRDKELITKIRLLSPEKKKALLELLNQ